MKAALIYNPAAGGGRRGSIARDAEAQLRRRGLSVRMAETQAPEDASRLARELASSHDAVVAVGGDGTINEVINGLHGTGVPLGIVPAGTANILALEMGIPRDVPSACDVIREGYSRALDLGEAGGRYFTLMAGAGLDALTIRELDPHLKRRLHKAAFVATGLKTHLRHPVRPFHIVVDGEEHEATFAVVGNMRYYGGRFGMTIHADPTDGLLDVLLFKGEGTATTGLFWLGSVFRLHTHHPQATYLRGTSVRLGDPPPSGPVWYQTDGELAGRLPIEVTVKPLALRLLVPELHDRRRVYAADRAGPVQAGAADLVAAHGDQASSSSVTTG